MRRRVDTDLRAAVVTEASAAAGGPSDRLRTAAPHLRARAVLVGLVSAVVFGVCCAGPLPALLATSVMRVLGMTSLTPG